MSKSDHPSAPKMGASVHWVSHGVPQVLAEVCRTATITRVDSDGTVDLAVLSPASLAFERHVIADHADRTPGTWHWCDCPDETPTDVPAPEHHH